MSTYEYIWLISGYLLGSISTAIVVCRLASLPDPRTQGSGNPGATNVLRVGGKKIAALVLAGDIIKGVIPVLAARLAGASLDLQITIGMATFLGHLYPIFFGFRGGKGVATAIGVLLTTSLPVGLCTVGTWLFVAKVMRISSLSALTAFLLTPVYVWWWEPEQTYYLVIVCIMTVMLFWRHRSNIRKLIEGSED